MSVLRRLFRREKSISPEQTIADMKQVLQRIRESPFATAISYEGLRARFQGEERNLVHALKLLNGHGLQWGGEGAASVLFNRYVLFSCANCAFKERHADGMMICSKKHCAIDGLPLLLQCPECVPSGLEGKLG